MSVPSFAAFILTNGRPDNVITYATLRRSGYTGPIYLIVDDLDETIDAYRENYPDEVIVFDKRAIAQTFDQSHNFQDMRSPIYARNASWAIARDLGLDHFVQLDDDYTRFSWRFNSRFDYQHVELTQLDSVFAAMVAFSDGCGAAAVALAQGGDYLGGPKSTSNPFVQAPTLIRKCMNSFVCATARPFTFVGCANDDVTTYTHKGSTGLLFFTLTAASLNQIQTQMGDGGMTELYKEYGTYVKSFYSVLYQPSSVHVCPLQSRFARLHHRVTWRHTVPKILSETWRKS